MLTISFLNILDQQKSMEEDKRKLAQKDKKAEKRTETDMSNKIWIVGKWRLLLLLVTRNRSGVCGSLNMKLSKQLCLASS